MRCLLHCKHCCLRVACILTSPKVALLMQGPLCHVLSERRALTGSLLGCRQPLPQVAVVAGLLTVIASLAGWFTTDQNSRGAWMQTYVTMNQGSTGPQNFNRQPAVRAKCGAGCADLHIRAGSLLPTANNEQAAKYQHFPRCPEY